MRIPAVGAALALSALAAVLVASRGEGLAQLQRKKGLRPETKTCLDCHRAQQQSWDARPSRHEPVRSGRCETCHMRHGVVGVLRLVSDDPQLCLSCHMQPHAAASRPPASSPKPAPGAKPEAHGFSHPPGEALQCGACHEPHGADHTPLLRATGDAQCASCHAELTAPSPHPHAAGTLQCTTCHDPHGSSLPGNLTRPAANLCISCHSGSSEVEMRAHGGHAPEPGSCMGCHTPHPGPAKGMLRLHIHSPVGEGEGACGTCHEPAAEGGKAWALTAPVPDLCVTCHDDPRTASAGGSHAGGGQRVHPPVAEGECLACHTPHASDQDHLLAAPEADLCGTCHDEAGKARSAKAAHKPAVAECTACHASHAGPAGLLRAAAPDLCRSCHPGVTEEIARPVTHPPAKEQECLTCHDPHGSDHPGILVESGASLCLQCHQGVATQLDARVPHPPASEGDCASCHEPHGGRLPHLVVDDLAKACLSCHKETEAASRQAHGHAPFTEGDCLSCHRPHASSRENLLSGEPGALCRACHGDLEGEAGAVSWHLPARRGQCLSCHAPHAAPAEALMRRSDDRTICLSCHTAESRLAARGDVQVHPPFGKDSCLTCHKPHAAGQDSLLVKAPAALCATCHDATSSSMKGPHRGLLGAEDDCTDCHEPHAAEKKPLLLPHEHPPFAERDCSACHPKEGP